MTQKRTIFCVVMLMCALFGSAQVIELSDGWECQSSAGGKSYVTKVPTTVMGALVSNGEFPDLFVRDNYKKAGRSYKHTPKQTLRELALYNKNPQLRDYLKNYLK